MNAVVTKFAYKNRFRLNGKKSAVMAFGANKEDRARVKAEPWQLSGERVEVKDRYKYLGVDVPEKFTSWTYHVERLIKKAQARSSELLWLCRRDRGLRPRAAVTMWQALVRPILEYAGELWAGEIPKSLEDRVEQVQTKFGKALLGLQDRIWIPADAVRAELGMERLATRREKLRLGYWWRIKNPNKKGPCSKWPSGAANKSWEDKDGTFGCMAQEHYSRRGDWESIGEPKTSAADWIRKYGKGGSDTMWTTTTTGPAKATKYP